MNKNEIIDRVIEKIKEEACCRNVLGDNFIHISEKHLDDIAKEMKDHG